MISVEGAGLIAQVVPVGLLIVTVEQKWLGPAKREPGPIGTVWWYIALPYKALTVLTSLLAIWACLASVSNAKPLDGFDASLVSVSLASLGMMVFATLLALLSYGYVGRDKAIANIERYDRQQRIVDRAHRVARIRRRAEKQKARGARPSTENASDAD
ncbi:hypothetical protein J2Y41_004669 [Arthrobacter sp. 1088]|uniref:hypothetical protein n=1 Tax=Arthrobacter sp. 1088 TaxID=2817768 RepID=UPI00286557EF|nr:hypothetical protein [Arthrobacter sp. 1088]MDR6689065.1 hypothetical protein [Arthrobacter sp. 1088]